MLKLLFTPAFLLLVSFAFAQDYGFSFGKVNAKDVSATSYPLDTTASVIYLNEYGEAYISDSDYKLVFNYHAQIKVLKKGGLSIANFRIPLYQRGENYELVRDIKASSFNIENNQVKETKLEKQNIFTEDPEKYFIVKKFAVPEVRVGSVIEVSYTIESPYIMNFHEWEFQGKYPKLRSEYQPTIPANYVYNASLRGYLDF